MQDDRQPVNIYLKITIENCYFYQIKGLKERLIIRIFQYLFDQSTSLVLSDDLTINSNTTLRSQITNFLNEEEEKLKEEESIMETLAEFQNSNNEQKMGNNDTGYSF